MNKLDFLYKIINNYIAIQTMSSFCLEAITEADISDSQVKPLEVFGKMIPINDQDIDVDELCKNFEELATLNMYSFLNATSQYLSEELRYEYLNEAKNIVIKYSDKNENFIFTTDAFYDIMEIYWKFERQMIQRRLNK